MSIWYKKTLGILGLGLATTMISSSVVSCGASFDAILNRVMSTDVHKSIYTNNVSSWNTAHSMQAEDSRIWSNTFDTFLSTDQYGRIYGSLAVSEYGQDVKGPDHLYVGVNNEDSTEWTYKMREMNWVDYKGNIVKDGKNASVYDGVIRAAKYALNPANGSDVSSLWTSFIVGAEDIYESIGKAQDELEGKELEDAIQKQYARIENPDEFGISSKNEDGKELITFKLAKAAPYFESLLTYSVFSPINSVNPQTTGPVNKFEDAYYNGAYYVQQANPNGKIILKKNEHYALKQSTNIETLEFNYLEDASASRERTLFESGSTSSFELKSDDLKGWSRYIGKGKEAYDNPNFGAAYEVESPDKAASFMLVYNYYNANIDDASVGVVEQNRALNASKLLQSKDVRAFISTTLNRSDFARYFSKTIDDVGQNSQMLRNTYTAEGVAQDEKGIDYTQYVAREFDKSVGNEENLEGSISLKDGQDPYKTYAKELSDNKTSEELIKDINKFIEINGINKQDIKGYGKRVVLRLILSPSNNNSLNPYLNLMMKGFNSIENNPIYIETKTLPSNDDYRTAGSKGATDLFISGWSPDYKDPSSFLETITLTGPYRGYNGTVRLFEKNKEGNYVVKNKNLLTKKSESSDQGSATEDLLKAFESFSNDFKETDANVTIPSERYTQFAEQENSFFYENFLSLSLYTKALPKVWTVSYLAPYTKSYEAFGTAQFKFYNTYLNSKLLSEKEWKEKFEEYKQKMAVVKSDWTKWRSGAHWSTETNGD
ncbi:ABC transporter substrate-binding protein [Spiroplasma diminutum]|uniref:Oligopeptide ABC transporter substrate-binding protein n=1 Tax=Spiroplasma diminutum CUAS-1 TaxID=1276221 RepID=S5LX01_9MOLU|nr:ABC transporter substrate-binding protein [Spiroplasma diminutum]AGR42329.1 oligopeptide ABC transporter substrate-binding protein [Spiroplasma diminutum CUAS-1]